MRILPFLAVILVAFVTTTVAADMSKMKRWTGGAPPPLALKDLDGQERALADYRGKVVVLNFWATWCAPCIEEMPSFERLAEKLADEPFALVTVNFGEKPARITPFLKKINVDVPVLLDTDMRASKAWVKKGLPTTYIIDADQNIRYQVLGEIEWDAPEVESKIRNLLPNR
ncbi:MAG TPA: TlpA disulfide reductase family protein [Burkholderiales bacterium]|nr:TlpA disulfide reductase family protein [Burkholderiales bacterium]